MSPSSASHFLPLLADLGLGPGGGAILTLALDMLPEAKSMTLALLGLLVLSAPLPPAAGGGVVKDLAPSARLALHGYMVHCPDPVAGKPGLLRASFGCNALPSPVVGHAQWDWGDCTGRAVQAWLFARRITGEADFGRDVERAQRATLLSLLTPTRGMPCVPDSPTRTTASTTTRCGIRAGRCAAWCAGG